MVKFLLTYVHDIILYNPPNLKIVTKNLHLSLNQEYKNQQINLNIKFAIIYVKKTLSSVIFI